MYLVSEGLTESLFRQKSHKNVAIYHYNAVLFQLGSCLSLILWCHLHKLSFYSLSLCSSYHKCIQ